jgi:hypothetical protein
MGGLNDEVKLHLVDWDTVCSPISEGGLGIRNVSVAPQILIVLFLIYLFNNIIQLISLRSLWYYGGW